MSFVKPVIAGNWKMHHGPAEARRFLQDFLQGIPGAGTVALFPPAISLSAAREALGEGDRVLLGVQNVYWESKGAFTGEISAPMAAEAGARLVLVGHSERRHVFGETPEETRRKVAAVLRAGLVPVLCVGETLAEREAGKADEVVVSQLAAAYEGLDADLSGTVLVAYEPVWAIGTGRTATPEDAAEMHGRIRGWLSDRIGSSAADRVPILYGGSVKPDNAAALLATPDVDGVLVGGASLDPADFAAICAAVA